MPSLWQWDENLFRSLHLLFRQHWLDPFWLAVSASGVGLYQIAALCTPAAASAIHSRLRQVSRPTAFWCFAALGMIGAGLAEKSVLGSLGFLLVLSLTATFPPRALLTAVWVNLGAGLVRVLMSESLHRPRPSNLPFAQPLEHVFGPTSFPSGHTTTSFAVAAYLFLAHKEGPLAVKLTLLAWALLGGLSRIAVGVHYPLDVLTGALLGAGVACLTHYALELKTSTRPSPESESSAPL